MFVSIFVSVFSLSSSGGFLWCMVFKRMIKIGGRENRWEGKGWYETNDVPTAPLETSKCARAMHDLYQQYHVAIL